MPASKKSGARSGGKKSRGKTPKPSTSRSDRTLSSRVSSPSSSKSKVDKQPQAWEPRPTSAPATTQADETAARLGALRTNWERIAGAAALASLVDALGRVTETVDDLNRDINTVRARGYRFGGNWENDLKLLNTRWPQQHREAVRLLEHERRVLQSAARDAEQLLQRAHRDAGLVSTAESRIYALQDGVNRAERRIHETFDGTWEQAQALREEVQQAQFLLDALDSASFTLLPDEHGIAVCQATWVSDAQEPEGLLYLTDKRLVFEQRQEIATKKILFITTEKELIQEKLWESPIGAIEALEAEDQRAFLQRREMLTLRFNERTRETPGDVMLHLHGVDNETWKALIRRAKAGEIDSDRFGAAAPSEQLAMEIEKEKAAGDTGAELPTVCPYCGAPLPPIFKGMTQVVCDYCGQTTNL